MPQVNLISMAKREHVLPEGATYIGRANGPLPRAPLSNPFSVKEHGFAAIGLYRLYIARAVVELDERIVGALVELADVVYPLDGQHRDCVLACWCVEREAAPCARLLPAPARPCHGDLVASAVEQLGRQLRSWTAGGFELARKTWSARIRSAYGVEPLAPVIFAAFGARALAELAHTHEEVARGVSPSMRGYCERWQPQPEPSLTTRPRKSR